MRFKKNILLVYFQITHFASNNGTELKEGFEVSGSGTALLETLPCFTGMTNSYKPPSPQQQAPLNARKGH